MINLKMRCDAALIPDTALYLSHVALKFGVTNRKANRICFVVETILELRVQEANRRNPYILLDMKKEMDELLISITDKGLPYVLTDDQKMILENGLVDSFRFEQLGAAGQRITVSFRQDAKQTASVLPYLEESEEVWQDMNFTCRPTKPEDEDIVHAIQCIYTSYGYDYIHQELYNVDIFKEMLRSGRYVSVQAGNAAGQVAGHVALEEHPWFPGLMEVCNLVVKPGIRGQNISGALVKSIMVEGLNHNLRGLYAMPAMFHPISQKLSTANGFYPCGMYFHLLGNTTTGEYGDGTNRLSAGFAIHMYDTEAAHTLYLPEECSEFVRDIFEHEKQNYTGGTEAADPSAKTSLSYNIDPLSGRLEIKIDAAGRDLEDRLQGLFFGEDSEVVEVVMVYLNANDPACPAVYRHLRDQGLLFTGCLPGSGTHDYLLLQHLKGRTLNRTILVSEPDYQRTLDRLYEINGML